MGDSADKHTAHLKKLEELGHTGGWLYGVCFCGGMIFFCICRVGVVVMVGCGYGCS